MVLSKPHDQAPGHRDVPSVTYCFAATLGHPYGTQELCYFLWQETPAGEEATAARLEAALTKVLRSEHAHFSLVWDRASRVAGGASRRDRGAPQ